MDIFLLPWIFQGNVVEPRLCWRRGVREGKAGRAVGKGRALAVARADLGVSFSYL